jgi:formamidopyrimidine-DNA glycosylase
MPELPEVETVCRGLAEVLVGRRLVQVVLRRADLRRPIPVDFRQRLQGATVTRVFRRAKYGLIETDRGDVAIVHLGMSGSIRMDPDQLGRHDHAQFETDDGHVLSLHDPRRFGSLDLAETSSWEHHVLFAHLGPEPLSDAFNATALRSRLAGRRSSIKILLLDQTVVAGVGNIYACEALFDARIRPSHPGGRLSLPKLSRLTAAVKDVLVRAIAAGGSSLRDHVRVNGELGYFQHAWSVYGREGEACRHCGALIKRRVHGGRSTFYCRICQT